MASLQSTVESIRIALISTSTCSNATTTILGELLFPTTPASTTKISTKFAEGGRSRGAKVSTRSRRKSVNQGKTQDHANQLSPNERLILATEVINATLKALGEAIKAPAPLRRKDSSKEFVKASNRQVLRRSNSLPQTPLQPRSLNRVSSSPDISTRNGRSSSSASITFAGNRCVAECARLAFAYLRSLRSSKTPGIHLPPLQLENGMSILVGKLVSLGLDDLALKEIRILKRRLDVEETQLGTDGPAAKTQQPSTLPQTLVELLDFGKASFSGAKLALVITTQLQVLRLMASLRDFKHVGAVLPILQLSHSSSPTRLLLIAAKESNPGKCVRQLQSLSETLLSLCPSISQGDDAIALDCRSSVAPEIAMRLQTLALHNRVQWWRLAGHTGDLAKEIFDPFLRCLSAFARRAQGTSLETYQLSVSGFLALQKELSDLDGLKACSHKLTLLGIYRLLGSLSREANLIDEAISWTQKVQALLNPKTDSEARHSAVAARLVGLALRGSGNPKDEEQLLVLLDGLERPFKGASSEIDELLTEVSATRRAAVAIIANTSPTAYELTDGMREMCESLILLCPRLSLRYLGASLDPKWEMKELVRYEQRRKFITKFGKHAIDSALFLVKTLLGKGRLTWEVMDSKLQDCLLLLERLDEHSEKIAAGYEPSSYYVRISDLYFTQFLNMGRDSGKYGDGQKLQAIRRSIDAVRSRPQHEKRAALLSIKLERMAEACRIHGRYDELFKTLVTHRDELVSNGVLSKVSTAAGTHPILAAWSQDEETMVLGRIIQSLVKVQMKHLSSVTQDLLFHDSWTEQEQGVVLEHYLEILPSGSNFSLGLQTKVFQALLSLYDPQKYPIRRMRVISRLLSLEAAQRQAVVEQEVADGYDMSKVELVIEGTRDEGLQGYLLHFQALNASLLELQQNQPRIDVLKQSLKVWSSIRARCQSLISLELQIEDLPAFLDHLQSVADFMEVKGFDAIRIATIRLVKDFHEIRDKSALDDNFVLSLVHLGNQWIRLGYSGKAGLVLDRAQVRCHQNGAMQCTLLQLHLAYAEYLLSIGSLDKCEEHLLQAQLCFMGEKDHDYKGTHYRNLEETNREYQLLSKAYLLCSTLALERGIPQLALTHAKHGIRLLRRAWTNATARIRSPNISTKMECRLQTEIEKLAAESLQTSVSTITIPSMAEDHQSLFGSGLWCLITPLFRSLLHLSGLYAHHGMFQETMYYAEQAHKLAKQVGSNANEALAAASLGRIWLKAGALDIGAELLMQAKSCSVSSEISRDSALLVYYLGNMHGLLGNQDAELASYEEAELILKSLTTLDFINGLDCIVDPVEALQDMMADLKVSKLNASTRKITTRAKAPAKRRIDTRVKGPIDVASSPIGECPQLLSFKAMVLRNKAQLLMCVRRCADALPLLHEAEGYSNSQMDVVDQGLAVAKQLLLRSLEQMNSDPVYSVLQESTISFPSVVGQHLKVEKGHGERLSFAHTSHPGKAKIGRCDPDQRRSKSPSPDGFFDNLRQAQERLTEVHSIATMVGPVVSIHMISSLLNTVAMLLSATGEARENPLTHPGFASCFTEMGRTLALRRERKAIQADPQAKLKLDETCWPTLVSADPRRFSNGSSSELSKFQKEYVDIIPPAWTVISISLSDSRNELSITKLQPGHSPFVLRLPLGRNNSIDADEEVFGFAQGHSELMEIIDLANESAHDARDMSTREAKASWWSEREALDARLRDLLENIEKVWLGGFTGIFSQHARRQDLLARFQKSFQTILDKHLPSRRKTGKRSTNPRVSLDSRILDLFIGLGDASEEGRDFSEPLTDLLYFVVDILQFHGELNAYAEIDFDSIVVETHDALRYYHEAVRASNCADVGRHTVLILDKALHAFPWESLPCMVGQAVSRLPSLGSLRDRILASHSSTSGESLEGQYISRNNGTYVLNPGGDLKSTQSTFQKPLQSLNNWHGIIRQEPTEEEIRAALESQDLFLYFGHGSGAQYIRAREIRKLDKCAVTLLMGCSSGALSEAGEFEPYGPPINYLQAGCPALVATLWDVTDKDIDRFAMSALDLWGLFQPQTDFKGGKGGKSKVKKRLDAEEKKLSLVEAVAKGREACNLRYLNAAAVCVYGIPVYFK